MLKFCVRMSAWVVVSINQRVHFERCLRLYMGVCGLLSVLLEKFAHLILFIAAGWCGWKTVDQVFKKGTFYNLCMPIRPRLI